MKGWRRWVVGAIVAAALLGIVLHMGELDNYLALLRRSQPGWLLAAVLLQLSTYVSLALGWREVLRVGDGRPFALRSLVRIAFSKLFADQALPTAGMGGNVLLMDQLTAAGATRGAAMAVLLISIRAYYAAYLQLALACLFLLWLHGQATALMAGVVTTFILVALAIPALALWLRRRGSKPLPAGVERIRPIAQLLETMAEAPASLVADRALLLRVTAYNALVFAADIATLYACLRGLGEEAGLSTAFIAFTLASIVVTLGPIPLGLGTFEATSTSTLHLLGVPIEAALSATLLLRFLTLWLPLVPGFIQMHRITRPHRAKRADG
ncbi:lysylphosphatidylglycerol synthase transmembrane domain-containing protein [Altererythrobacter fulvus]|uniref:lysylphosphatidylglycerol synthase transmembrane domain-containing protein n=1 Tax=Caenibius fulvus TaxID=2126012 RepID=UPI00301B43AA